MDRQRLVTIALVGLAAASCWFFPLFHVRPLGGSEASQWEAERKASRSSNGDSPRTLDAYTNSATEIINLWQAFDTDAKQAKEEFGQQAGLGGAFYFCVRGKGLIESLDKDRVVLSVEGSPRRVCLELGFVIGNTVREAVGVKASAFTNSQDFNALSSELNRKVEELVIAPNRAQLQVESRVEFVGCTKVSGKSDLDPLCLIPIQLTISP